MTKQLTIEERVANLESQVAQLQQRLPTSLPNGQWHNPMAGIQDLDLLDLAMEFARELRDADAFSPDYDADS